MFHVRTSDICPCQIWISRTALVSSRKLRAYTQERGTAYKLRPSPSDPPPCARDLNNMPALVPPKSTDLGDELERYLNTDIEDVPDPIAWWHEHCTVYPHLSDIALDYLIIPGESMPALLYGFILTCFFITLTATSVNIEHLFSKGYLLLSHVHSCLMFQSTQALLCLGYWSCLNLIKTEDIIKISSLLDVEDANE
jgi:hypothetical protein